MPVPSIVPDFFQEETTDALRSQVDWQAQELGLEHSFFARLVGADAETFSRWRARDAELPAEGEETLRQHWQMMLHLLSFLGFDRTRVQNLFRETMPAPPSTAASALTPPWAGESLETYLESGGRTGIEKVERWVTGMRFGDPYAA